MVWLLVLSLLGILDAGYLTYKARKRQAPVCPFGQSCAFVLSSRYNHVLGVKNEVLGLLFYLGVAAASALTLAGILAIPGWLWVLGLGGSLAMAIVLSGIQVLVLRAYCSWCIASAVINALLFVVGISIFV